MTRTLGSGCRRLMWERGSSIVENEATISSSLLRVLAIADLRPPVSSTTRWTVYQSGRAQGRKVYQIVIKVAGWPLRPPRLVWGVVLIRITRTLWFGRASALQLGPRFTTTSRKTPAAAASAETGRSSTTSPRSLLSRIRQT